MERYIDADKLQKDGWKLRREKHGLVTSTFETMELDCVPTTDVVEADKVQKEIDYWHDKAQNYEQTILKLSLNKAEQPENCEGCKHLGKWENEVKYGYPSFEILSPCTRCKRRAEDHYER